LRAGAPIDGFGIGTSLSTSSDVPALDCAYKLQEYAGLARRKRSAGKATWPGRKQVWRRFRPDGQITGDVIALEASDPVGEPLLVPVMRDGKRISPRPTLDEMRAIAARNLASLPSALRGLAPGGLYPVQIADDIVRLAGEVDRRVAHERSEG